MSEVRFRIPLIDGEVLLTAEDVRKIIVFINEQLKGIQSICVSRESVVIKIKVADKYLGWASLIISVVWEIFQAVCQAKAAARKGDITDAQIRQIVGQAIGGLVGRLIGNTMGWKLGGILGGSFGGPIGLFLGGIAGGFFLGELGSALGRLSAMKFIWVINSAMESSIEEILGEQRSTDG